MYKQLDLFKKSQPSDLEKLDDMVSIQQFEDIASHGKIDNYVEERVSYQEPDGVSSQIDWDIQVAYDSGDTERYHELLQIKHDMN